MVGKALSKSRTYDICSEQGAFTMRGPSKSLPKYAKHKASGKAVVRLNGTDIYLGPYGTKTSKLEYDRVIGEWLANGRMLPTSKTNTN
jgi:hypothetical protein